MLETPRLLLRPHLLSDAADLFLLNQDPEVTRFTGDIAYHTVEDAQTVIRERLMAQFSLYKMGRFHVALRNGTYLGWCGLRYFPEQNSVDLGYRFLKKHWGQGFATEASRVCLDYGFRTLGLERISATAMPENISSIKVLQKLGMTFKGVQKEKEDPAPLIYELLARDFKS
jgi:[ribosomal protein S5]-alanine N-acetyltransferase